MVKAGSAESGRRGVLEFGKGVKIGMSKTEISKGGGVGSKRKDKL